MLLRYDIAMSPIDPSLMKGGGRIQSKLTKMRAFAPAHSRPATMSTLGEASLEVTYY